VGLSAPLQAPRAENLHAGQDGVLDEGKSVFGEENVGPRQDI
jgi:hypothetical protein